MPLLVSIGVPLCSAAGQYDEDSSVGDIVSRSWNRTGNDERLLVGGTCEEQDSSRGV